MTPPCSYTYRLFLLLLWVLPLVAQAQTNTSADAPKAIVKVQLTKMEEAFKQQDFETFAEFMHPDVLRMSGGAEVFASQMRKGMSEMEAQGTKVLNVKHGEPSKIVKVDKELQCTVPQTTEFQFPGETKTINSTLVAISSDSGQHWYFVDTNGKDWETVRRLIPSLSRELVLPGRK
jgi:hypothetical protein